MAKVTNPDNSDMNFIEKEINSNNNNIAYDNEANNYNHE